MTEAKGLQDEKYKFVETVNAGEEFSQGKPWLVREVLRKK